MIDILIHAIIGQKPGTCFVLENMLDRAVFQVNVDITYNITAHCNCFLLRRMYKSIFERRSCKIYAYSFLQSISSDAKHEVERIIIILIKKLLVFDNTITNNIGQDIQKVQYNGKKHYILRRIEP